MPRLRNRGGETTIRNSFSYILPFIIALFLIIIVVRYIFSPGGAGENGSGSFINITPSQEQSEIYIYMSGDSKNRIDATSKMYATDSKLTVVTWEAEIGFEGSIAKFFLDKWGELRYTWVQKEKQTLSLENAYLWVESADSNLDLSLANFRVIPNHDAIIILSQNTIASNIYVIKGSATIETIGATPTSTSIGVGQQLTVLRNEAESASLQIASKIEPLSDFIKTTDLFIKHDGESLLSSSIWMSGTGETASGSITLSGSTALNSKGGILITSPEDGSTVDTNEITVEGKIINPTIAKITINGKDAAINTELKTFIYKGLSLENASNDIVYKAFDSDGNIIQNSRGILTVYTSKKAGVEDTSKKASVTTYPISDKDFQITAPSENPYKTTDDNVRIDGRVNKGVVKFITINNYRLSSFTQFGTTWHYFANKSYGSMNDGINLYTIRYYGENDELIFTNLFTIVKEKKEEPKPATEPMTETGGTTEG